MALRKRSNRTVSYNKQTSSKKPSATESSKIKKIDAVKLLLSERCSSKDTTT